MITDELSEISIDDLDIKIGQLRTSPIIFDVAIPKVMPRNPPNRQIVIASRMN